jgi:hypothetical protein
VLPLSFVIVGFVVSRMAVVLTCFSIRGHYKPTSRKRELSKSRGSK